MRVRLIASILFCLLAIFAASYTLQPYRGRPARMLQQAGGTPAVRTAPPTVATFSIVAYDPATQELGVAVQSKVCAVGAIVPFAKAGVGAVATQAFANTKYGDEALGLLAKNEAPEKVIETITAADALREQRQVGVINAKGQASTFTGKECFAWAGGIVGENFCCQGNILAGEDVVKAMQTSFLASKGPLAERLLAALQAGQDAGGDKRGMQSAALLIVREGWGYGGTSDRYRDLRVDDHAEPIKELKRVYEIHRAMFPPPQTEPHKD